MSDYSELLIKLRVIAEGEGAKQTAAELKRVTDEIRDFEATGAKSSAEAERFTRVINSVGMAATGSSQGVRSLLMNMDMLPGKLGAIAGPVGAVIAAFTATYTAVRALDEKLFHFTDVIGPALATVSLNTDTLGGRLRAMRHEMEQLNEARIDKLRKEMEDLDSRTQDTLNHLRLVLQTTNAVAGYDAERETAGGTSREQDVARTRVAVESAERELAEVAKERAVIFDQMRRAAAEVTAARNRETMAKNDVEWGTHNNEPPERRAEAALRLAQAKEAIQVGQQEVARIAAELKTVTSQLDIREAKAKAAIVSAESGLQSRVDESERATAAGGVAAEKQQLTEELTRVKAELAAARAGTDPTTGRLVAGSQREVAEAEAAEQRLSDFRALPLRKRGMQPITHLRELEEDARRERAEAETAIDRVAARFRELVGLYEKLERAVANLDSQNRNRPEG